MRRLLIRDVMTWHWGWTPDDEPPSMGHIGSVDEESLVMEGMARIRTPRGMKMG